MIATNPRCRSFLCIDDLPYSWWIYRVIVSRSYLMGHIKSSGKNTFKTYFVIWQWLFHWLTKNFFTSHTNVYLDHLPTKWWHPAVILSKLDAILDSLTPTINSHTYEHEVIATLNYMFYVNICNQRIYKHSSVIIRAWISNHMPNKMWDEVTHQFPHFIGHWNIGMDK